jgi:hypothetical protein
MSLLALTWAPPVLAQASVYNQPIYDPASKSYFELVKLTHAEAPKHYIPGMNWAEAEAYATQRVYKGVRGRLAVIKSLETHSLIFTKLRPSDNITAIGLRYFCKSRKAQWSNGDFLEVRDFQAWSRTWNQAGEIGCSERGYMSIAYTSVAEGFRWIAKGGLKAFAELLIEYPTGKP